MTGRPKYSVVVNEIMKHDRNSCAWAHLEAGALALALLSKIEWDMSHFLTYSNSEQSYTSSQQRQLYLRTEQQPGLATWADMTVTAPDEAKRKKKCGLGYDTGPV